MLYLGTPNLPPELDEEFDATFERLRRWFRSRGVLPEEAADLAQEVIARALVHLRRHGVDQDIGVDPLLNTIGRNLLIDRARSISPTVVPIEAAEHADIGFDPVDEVTRAAARRAVRAAIGTLSARHRRAMLLTLDGLTPAEIADHFGIQRNAADALLHRARRRLADQLRATIGATLGLVAVVVLRARSEVRRARTAMRHLDVAAPTLVANVTAAVLAFGVLGTAPIASDAIELVRETPALDRAVAEAPKRLAPRPTVSEPHRVAGRDGGRDGFRIERQVNDPLSGKNHTVYAGGHYRPGPSGREGIVWPVARTGLDLLCDAGGCM